MNTYLAGALAALVVCVGAFFYGMHVEHGRFMGFVAQVQTSGDAAAKDAARKMQAAVQRRKELEDAHKNAKAATDVELAALRGKLRDARARGSVVPAIPPAASGCDGSETGRTYWGQLRERVESALVRFEDGTVGSVQRAAPALDLARTCAAWAQREFKSQ